jgi:hypothetical protein
MNIAITYNNDNRPLRAEDFRLDAIALEPDLRALAREPLPGGQPADHKHWTLTDPNFMGPMRDLVASVRELQQLAQINDPSDDVALANRLLQHMGLWDHVKPVGQWGNARFMCKFLVAYARIYMVSCVHIGRRKGLVANGAHASR